MKKIQGAKSAEAGFDFPQLTTSPAYQKMVAAVSDAGNAMKDLLTDGEWAALLAVVGLVARYGDRCNNCPGVDLVFPHAGELMACGSAEMRYSCGHCGHRWFTSYGDSW